MVSVVGTIDTAHEDAVHDAALDYYGLRLATCSSDHTVRVFDVRAGQHALAAELKGHLAAVWQVAWAHPTCGRLLASCSYDRKVIVWKEGANGDWSKLHEYACHESSVNSVSWAPPEYGARLACASSDGSISVLLYSPDADAWEARKIPGAHAVGVNAVCWAPPNASTDAPKRLLSGGSDNLVKIWVEEGDQWVEESRLEIHTDWIRDVAWAPSLGLPRSLIASCSQDKRVVIWTSDDNRSWASTVLHTFDDVVWSVSWSLTGNILAVSGGDNKVSLWRENNEGQWVCISEVARGIGNINDDNVNN